MSDMLDVSRWQLIDKVHELPMSTEGDTTGLSAMSAIGSKADIGPKITLRVSGKTRGVTSVGFLNDLAGAVAVGRVLG
jgi:hypothetical protein